MRTFYDAVKGYELSDVNQMIIDRYDKIPPHMFDIFCLKRFHNETLFSTSLSPHSNDRYWSADQIKIASTYKGGGTSTTKKERLFSGLEDFFFYFLVVLH